MEIGTPPSREAVVAVLREFFWPSRGYCAENHAYNNVIGWGFAAFGFLVWGVDLVSHANAWGLLCLVLGVTRFRGAYFCALLRKW